MASIDRLDGPLPTWRLTDEDAIAEVIPSRGGLVTKFSVGGVPVLFLDDGTLLDRTKNVRGGVPVLFPFAGKPPAGSPLGQHGFARNREWEPITAIADDATARFECRLTSNAETKALWPFDFELTYAVSLFDQRLMLEWAFHNTGSVELPLHFGIHPYFVVGQKNQVRVEGALGKAYDNKAGVEREVHAVDFSAGEVDLHFGGFDSGGTTLARGDGHVVQLSWTEHFDTLVVWTLPDKPFVCVEPWTAAGQQPARLSVPPGNTERLAVAMWLQR